MPALKNRPLPDQKIGGDDAELLRVARDRYAKGQTNDKDNREEMLEDLEFASATQQWPEDLKSERSGDERPMLTINQMPQFIRQVTGDIKQNNPSAKARPADDVADEDIADIFTGTIRHIEAVSDAAFAYEHAATAAAAGGMGHWRVVTEYAAEDTFDQDIRVRPILDPFAVTWDPAAYLPTREDANYCFVEEEIDLDTFKARYPNASTSPFESNDTAAYLTDWRTQDGVKVAEYWVKVPETAVLAQLADNSVRTISEEEEAAGAVLDEAGAVLSIVQTREVVRKVVKMYLINGAEVLEEAFDWAGKFIPVVPVIGEEIHIGRKIVRHGVIRFSKDAQRMYNYWRSAQTEQIALQPKAPFMVTPKQIENLEPIWKQANKRNMPYLPYNPDQLAPPPQRTIPALASPAMADEVVLAREDMRATTGIYDAALGRPSNETSGRAILARQRESDISTVTYATNLNRAIAYGGRILVDLIPKVYDNQRVLRILNEDDTTKSVLVNGQDKDGQFRSLTAGKYDVVVTTGPSFNTKREETVETMTRLVQAVPSVGNVIMDILVRNLDLPGADEVAERLRKLLPPGIAEVREGEEPPQPAPPSPEQQLAIAEQERKDAETQAKLAETAAKIEHLMAQADDTQVEAASKAFELAIASGAFDSVLSRAASAGAQAVLAEMTRAEQGASLTPDPAASGVFDSRGTG